MSTASLSHAETLCLRQQALERWVVSHLGSIDHERRVREIAGKLFDLTWPLHGLGRQDRRLLSHAAIVHDVGRSVDDDTHPQQGARMLMEADHLPLGSSARRALAYLTRYHRGKVPDVGCDQILRRDDGRTTLRTLLGLLRGADSLDSRTIESPRLLFAMMGRRLHITCYLDDDTPKARKVYGRAKKFRLLEEVLGLEVNLQIAQAQVLQMVA